jgi:hypothetical protein
MKVLIMLFLDLEILGIGFEYNYSTEWWRMIRYYKGSPTTILK